MQDPLYANAEVSPIDTNGFFDKIIFVKVLTSF